MSNGADAHSHVSRIDQRNDDTVELYVETTSFTAGQAVEISGYVTQGSTYAAFNDKKHIPFPDSKDDKRPAVLHVQLPALDLDQHKTVTAVVRVAEVWPTFLEHDAEIVSAYTDHGLKAAWSAKYPEGKGPGDATSPPPGSGPGTTTSTPPDSGPGDGTASQQP
jgi:hypothetical protein